MYVYTLDTPFLAVCPRPITPTRKQRQQPVFTPPHPLTMRFRLAARHHL